MNQQPITVSESNDLDTPPEASIFDARVGAICSQIAALDEEIATLEQIISPLSDVLTALARHPVLWLLIGREGIDRPGTLGTIVGQQVVMVVRRDRTAVIIVGVFMLILGALLGSSGALVWTGVLP
jgi:hypothetical protein